MATARAAITVKRRPRRPGALIEIVSSVDESTVRALIRDLAQSIGFRAVLTAITPAGDGEAGQG